jgi:hypothetical protein
VIEAAKLLSAIAIGVTVTLVERFARRGQPLAPAMEQAYVLICLAGALTMLIIGDSLARAFGIAGAAAIIRFRTPIDDPRDITVIFLLMALGMAAGLGLAVVAGVGAVFLCACLLLLHRAQPDAPRAMRAMKVALVSEGEQFPAAHVSQVFKEHRVKFEPLEITRGDHTTVRYRAVLEPDASLEEVSAHLLTGGGAGIKSVSWEPPRKNL